MYYLELDDFHIVGASPEELVRVHDGVVTTRPIAGTKPRGRTQEEDDENERHLLADEKERAEHIMLVDLGRNDLGRVCKSGTVGVTELMIVERYSHVMHIVSYVQGELREDRTAYDALRSCFPAGTLSGAPKIRAMEIIAEMESDRRGPYGGAVGYFDLNGNMDTAITIRTMVIKDGVAHVQAGGGIVFDSVSPRPSTRRPSTRLPRCCGQSSARSREADGHDSTHRQLRQLHLQPVPVPVRAWRGRSRRAQRPDDHRGHRRDGPREDSHFARPLHAGAGRYLE